MKKYFLSLCVFFQASLGFAQGSLYSFSGNVSNLFYDGGGILASQNVAVGDPVFASYIVDFGAQGFYLHNDGSIDVPVEPPLGNVHTSNFYCRLDSATLLPVVNGGMMNRPQDIAEYFTGWNQSSPMGNEGLLIGGSGNSYFYVSNWDLNTVQDWQVGTDVGGYIVAYSDKDWSVAWANMKLNSITPIPEPSSFVMGLVGAAGLAAVMRRKAARK